MYTVGLEGSGAIRLVLSDIASHTVYVAVCLMSYVFYSIVNISPKCHRLYGRAQRYGSAQCTTPGASRVRNHICGNGFDHPAMIPGH